jgi:hypothetical protein
MKQQKPIKKTQKTEEIDPVFLKRVENLKEEEQLLMIKLYSKIIKEIKK